MVRGGFVVTRGQNHRITINGKWSLILVDDFPQNSSKPPRCRSSASTMRPFDLGKGNGLILLIGACSMTLENQTRKLS